MIGDIGRLDVDGLGAPSAVRRRGLNVGPLEVGVGATIKILFVHIDVDDGLKVIDGAILVFFKFLVERAGLDGDQVAPGVEDNLLDFGAVGFRFVDAVVGGDGVDRRPIVDGFVVGPGNQIQR